MTNKFSFLICLLPTADMDPAPQSRSSTLAAVSDGSSLGLAWDPFMNMSSGWVLTTAESEYAGILELNLMKVLSWQLQAQIFL